VLAALARDNRLDSDRRRRVDTALGDLLAETAYTLVDPLSGRAGTVWLIRQHAVSFASALCAAGHASEVTAAWLEGSRYDPLPESRHALLLEEE
jgi:hypothetical protein